MSEYCDDYPTCRRTHATLCIYPGEMTPDEVTESLGLIPTRTQLATSSGRRLHGWFLKTTGAVDSRDSRRHIDWLLDRLEPSSEAFKELVRQGAKTRVSCYWVSRQGHGGPTISPRQAGRLAELGLECGFDVYFEPDN